MKRHLLAAGAFSALLIAAAPLTAGATTPTEPPAPTTTTAASTTTVAAPRDAGVEIIGTGDPADTIDLWAPAPPPAPGTVLRTTETFAYIGSATLGDSAEPFTITRQVVETLTVTSADAERVTGTMVVESFDLTTDTVVAEALAQPDPRAQLIGVPVVVTTSADVLVAAEFAPEVVPTPEQSAALAELVAESGADVPLPVEPLGDGAEWVSPLDLGGPAPVRLAFELDLQPDVVNLAGYSETEAANVATDSTAAPVDGAVVVAFLVTGSRASAAAHTVITVQVDGFVGTPEEGFDLVGTIATTSTTDVVNPDGSTLSVAPTDTTAPG